MARAAMALVALSIGHNALPAEHDVSTDLDAHGTDRRVTNRATKFHLEDVGLEAGSRSSFVFGPGPREGPKWGKLTDDDVDRVARTARGAGREDPGAVCIEREEARRQVDEFLAAAER
jgi:hypothetical protein